MNRKRHAVPVLLALILGLGGIGFALAQSSGSGARPAPTPPDAVPVLLSEVARRDVPVLLSNIGAVQAFNSVLVRARVDGTLEKVLFTEGQEVKRGDLLAVIDPRPYAAALAQAIAKKAADQAQLAGVQKDLARTSSLVEHSFATRQTLDQQTAQVAQLQATLQGDDAAITAARLNLDFTQITAPIDGRVGLRMVDPGNLIHASDPQGIVSITQIRPIAVIFNLPQDELPQVQAALQAGKPPAFAYSSNGATRLGEGRLETMDNAVDQATGTIKLKAVFPNEQSRLWPGQFVNVRLEVQNLHNVLTVPSAAVQRGPDGLYVFVVKSDSTAKVQPVEIRQDDGEIAVVSKGLEEHEKVVVNGQSRLQNGTRVAEAHPQAGG